MLFDDLMKLYGDSFTVEVVVHGEIECDIVYKGYYCEMPIKLSWMPVISWWVSKDYLHVAINY